MSIVQTTFVDMIPKLIHFRLIRSTNSFVCEGDLQTRVAELGGDEEDLEELVIISFSPVCLAQLTCLEKMAVCSMRVQANIESRLLHSLL